MAHIDGGSGGTPTKHGLHRDCTACHEHREPQRLQAANAASWQASGRVRAGCGTREACQHSLGAGEGHIEAARVGQEADALEGEVGRDGGAAERLGSLEHNVTVCLAPGGPARQEAGVHALRLAEPPHPTRREPGRQRSSGSGGRLHVCARPQLAQHPQKQRPPGAHWSARRRG